MFGRSRQRAPNLRVGDRLLFGFLSLFLSAGGIRADHLISRTLGVDIDKNVVHRVLAKHYRPAPRGQGPSWLSFIGHMTDSLWSVDLFRCDSIGFRICWVLLIMDQFTRRLVGFAVHCWNGSSGSFRLTTMRHGVTGRWKVTRR